jgi:hypothetical protein
MTVEDSIAWPGILLVGIALASPLAGFAGPPAGSGDDAHGTPREIDCPDRRGAIPGPGVGGFSGGERPWDVPPPYLAGVALVLLRARTERDIYLLLTPEQRVQMLDRRRERQAHGPGRLPPP